jgi:hypothetical protein
VTSSLPHLIGHAVLHDELLRHLERHLHGHHLSTKRWNILATSVHLLKVHKGIHVMFGGSSFSGIFISIILIFFNVIVKVNLSVFIKI